MVRAPRRLRSLATLAVGLTVALAGLVSAPAGAARPPRTPAADGAAAQWKGLAPFDSRTAGAFTAQPTMDQIRARAELAGSLGAEGVLDVDPLTGTPRVVAKLDGFLTGASSNAGPEVALGYVRANLGAFGLSAADLGTLRLVRDYADIRGTHHLYWEQSSQGVPSFDHGLQASVTGDGRLINVLGSPMPGLSVDSTTPQISANSAVSQALRNSGAANTTPAPLVNSGFGPTRTATYANGDSASLVLFGDARGTRLAWQVDARASSTEHDISVVDATTGAVLWRANMVSFADVTGHGLAWQYADSSQPPPGTFRQQMRPFPVKDARRLFGNNAHVFADVNDDNHPKPGAYPAGDEIPASNQGSRTWAYHVAVNTSASARNCTPKFPCTWDSGQANSWKPNLRQNATQVYYYINNFHNHLLAPPIGFTEGAGNFELVNSTHHGRGGDPVLGHIDDGANTAGGLPDDEHQDNANMDTPADGHSPTMQMYLFPANSLGFPRTNPDSNGGDEASIVYHEYTHGLSHRMVTTPNGDPALNTFQSASMGEAWSDWYAMDYLVGQHFEQDTNTPGDIQLGYYSGGGHTQPIRTEGLDCPPGQRKPLCPGAGNAGPGGYTFGDMGKIARGPFGVFPEVHADGEIWGQTLWQVRQRLVASLGAVNGMKRAEEVVTRGMELSPPNPSFLDMRNAILQADEVVAGGHDHGLLWSVFAARGMGFYAHTDGPNDTHPVQNFVAPPGCANPTHCGTIEGVVTDSNTHDPLQGVVVGIVDHVTPGSGQSPDNLIDVTAADGSYSIPDVPRHGGYQLTTIFDGYEPSTATVNVQSASVTVNRAIKRDWASSSGGARIISFTRPDYTPFGCGPGGAIDTSQAVGWGSDAPGNSDSGVHGPRQITIRLPHVVDIDNFAVDPSETCGDDSSAAVKSFTIETKKASGPYVVAINRTQPLPLHHFTTLTPTHGTSDVLFVRFTMRTNRGNPAFMDLTELYVHGTKSP